MIKRDTEGKPVRYKARLVAPGFSQVPGVGYFDTHAPVGKLMSIRLLLAYAAAEDWELEQVDVKAVPSTASLRMMKLSGLSHHRVLGTFILERAH